MPATGSRGTMPISMRMQHPAASHPGNDAERDAGSATAGFRRRMRRIPSPARQRPWPGGPAGANEFAATETVMSA